MAQVPQVTISEYRDWQRRYGLKCDLPDELLGEALDRANKRAQKLEDEKEARRKSCRDSAVDNTPVFAIKFPAPTKEELINADRRIAASVASIPGSTCESHSTNKKEASGHDSEAIV